MFNLFNKKANKYKYSLSPDEFLTLEEELEKKFVEAGITLGDPTVRAIFAEARKMAIESAEAELKAKKTCTRDCIIITLTAAAGSAATYFLAPIPEQYKIPATIGVGAVGAIADVARIAHKHKKVNEAEMIAAGSMVAFGRAMGIVSPKADPAPTQPAPAAAAPAASAASAASTEEIVSGESKG